jgi:hypothetical protein
MIPSEGKNKTRRTLRQRAARAASNVFKGAQNAGRSMFRDSGGPRDRTVYGRMDYAQRKGLGQDTSRFLATNYRGNKFEDMVEGQVQQNREMRHRDARDRLERQTRRQSERTATLNRQAIKRTQKRN